MLTAIGHGSVGPKRMAKAISESKAVYTKHNKHKNMCVNTDFNKYFPATTTMDAWRAESRKYMYLSVYDHCMTRKGIRLIFLNQDGEIASCAVIHLTVQLALAVTQTSTMTPAAALGRVVFSL